MIIEACNYNLTLLSLFLEFFGGWGGERALFTVQFPTVWVADYIRGVLYHSLFREFSGN